jgi:Trehalose-phosphatase
VTPTPDKVLAEHAARVAAQAQTTALCLDFDGTLAPIVDDPNQARPLPGMVEVLGQLAARFACCRVARLIIWPSMLLPRECATSDCTDFKRSATGSYG